MGAGSVSLRQQFWDRSHPFLGLRNLLFFPLSGDVKAGNEMMQFWWPITQETVVFVFIQGWGGSSGLGLESFRGGTLGLIESGGLNSIGSEDLTLVITHNSVSPPARSCHVHSLCAELL